MYILTYRRRAFIFSTVLGFIFLVFSLLYLLGIIISDELPVFPMVFSALILIFIPISVYFSAKKNFYTHGRLQEQIVYEITDKEINISGESFKSQMTWEKTYKVQELKDWFLIYQNKLVANVIPKNSTDLDIVEFRRIVRNQNVKSKLKRDT
ncbi:YcxB family protein [Maribellus sp. YY47]|uniref:YcxB family protein n=1 Tax=Maribellus sp. YY47 TaxID=2929486 RepID=UPI002000F7AA|nr:YcxB family protein [Maribellus sp. YY47]MCK3684602.1 YcxB family protein [Maribellus sp. YY47]